MVPFGAMWWWFQIRATAATTLILMLERPMYPCSQDTDSAAQEGLSDSEKQILLELQAGNHSHHSA